MTPERLAQLADIAERLKRAGSDPAALAVAGDDAVVLLQSDPTLRVLFGIVRPLVKYIDAAASRDSYLVPARKRRRRPVQLRSAGNELFAQQWAARDAAQKKALCDRLGVSRVAANNWRHNARPRRGVQRLLATEIPALQLHLWDQPTSDDCKAP